MINIGIDCDGIQFNFCKLYSQVINELFPAENYPLFDDHDVPQWGWENWHPAGAERIKQAWDHLLTLPDIYEREEVLLPANVKYMISKLNNHPKINTYFITARPDTNGRPIIKQTINQLKAIGWDDPQVIIADSKGGISKVLNLKHFIDDRAENCAEVALYHRPTKVYVLDKQYNRFLQEKYFGITRINNVMEFTDAVLASV